jgi:hypothetical protein
MDAGPGVGEGEVPSMTGKRGWSRADWNEVEVRVGNEGLNVVKKVVRAASRCMFAVCVNRGMQQIASMRSKRSPEARAHRTQRL